MIRSHWKTLSLWSFLAFAMAACGSNTNPAIAPSVASVRPAASVVPFTTTPASPAASSSQDAAATARNPTATLVPPSTALPSTAMPAAQTPGVGPTPLSAAATLSPSPVSALPKLPVQAVALPDGQGGIGFDDLVFDAGLDKVIAPGGRSGKLDLIDPVTRVVTGIGGFTAQKQFEGGHGVGTTSADAGGGLLFAIDRNMSRLLVVDPVKQAILGSAPLGGSPDYVRYVAVTHESWVTEPDSEQIEVFSLPDGKNPVRTATITVSGGPESLVIDGTRKLAYTHLWAGRTVAIDLPSRAIRATWVNGCRDSRGIALDEPRGFLFAGCAEGRAVVLDAAHNGKQLGSLSFGLALDVISYNPVLAHLYLPGSASSSLGIAGVGADGTLTLLGAADVALGAHCVAADNRGQAWVCDPVHGQLLLLTDTLPAAGR